MIKVKIQVPEFQRIRIDADTLNKKIANRAALHVRKRMKKGEDADGPLPTVVRDDGSSGPMLDHTGELIKSIKARPSKRGPGRVVVATGNHSGGTRNGAIMAIQIAQREASDRIDPMGESDAMSADLQKTADKEMTRQAKSGKLGLVHQLRRLKG